MIKASRNFGSRNLIQNLRNAGAKEIHMRITAPPVKYSCYYGIDTPSRKNLIAASMSIEEIKELIGADSLAFISIEGMTEAARIGGDKLCKACFDGLYPVDPCLV